MKSKESLKREFKQLTEHSQPTPSQTASLKKPKRHRLKVYIDDIEDRIDEKRILDPKNQIREILGNVAGNSDKCFIITDKSTNKLIFISHDGGITADDLDRVTCVLRKGDKGHSMHGLGVRSAAYSSTINVGQNSFIFTDGKKGVKFIIYEKENGKPGINYELDYDWKSILKENLKLINVKDKNIFHSGEWSMWVIGFDSSDDDIIDEIKLDIKKTWAGSDVKINFNGEIIKSSVPFVSRNYKSFKWFKAKFKDVSGNPEGHFKQIFYWNGKFYFKNAKNKDKSNRHLPSNIKDPLVRIDLDNKIDECEISISENHIGDRDGIMDEILQEYGIIEKEQCGIVITKNEVPISNYMLKNVLCTRSLTAPQTRILGLNYTDSNNNPIVSTCIEKAIPPQFAKDERNIEKNILALMAILNHEFNERKKTRKKKFKQNKELYREIKKIKVKDGKIIMPNSNSDDEDEEDEEYEEYRQAMTRSRTVDSYEKEKNEEPVKIVRKKQITRKKISDKIKEEEWVKQHKGQWYGNCIGCERRIRVSLWSRKKAPDRAEFGHIISKKNGGKEDITNMVWQCHACNSHCKGVNMLDYYERNYGKERRIKVEKKLRKLGKIF